MDLNGSTILLTGGTGSFGNAFVERLIRDHPGAVVRIFSRDELKQSEMQSRLAGQSDLRFFVGDVRNRSRLARAMRSFAPPPTPSLRPVPVAVECRQIRNTPMNRPGWLLAAVIAYACANAADRLPDGTDAFPVNYWDGMTPEEASEFFGPTTGLHANRGEMSAVLAIDPDLFDKDAANAEMPPFPDVSNPAAVHTAFFFSNPGSVYRATHSGTWGNATDASPEFGERYLQVVTAATVRLLGEIQQTFEAMPRR